jgi:AmiR/NasT family two-component response regulator
VTLFRDLPGPLEDTQYTDALLMAVVSFRTILALQADAPPGSVAAELEKGSNFHFVVHQAAGMVSVQQEIGVTEALVRLRAHAFLTERSIDEVSQDVVDRKLRLASVTAIGPVRGTTAKPDE